DTSAAAESGARVVWRRDLDGPGVAPGGNDLRQPDRVLPDRRAARSGAAMGDWQGKVETMAVPALRSTERADGITSLDPVHLMGDSDGKDVQIERGGDSGGGTCRRCFARVSGRRSGTNQSRAGSR